MSRYTPGPLVPRIRAQQHLADRQRERKPETLPEPTAPFALIEPPLIVQAVGVGVIQILRAWGFLRALVRRRA